MRSTRSPYVHTLRCATFWLAAATGLAVLSPTAFAADLTGKQTRAAKAAFSDVGGKDQPGCAVGVRVNGRTLITFAQGQSRIGDDVPLTVESVFDIGSTSKQFTAASIQLLVGNGRIKLSDTAKTYVPELPAFAKNITVEQLIHHTGGLPDYNRGLFAAGNDPADVVTTQQTMDWISSLTKSDFTPGSKYAYSNTGYFILSQIVERVSKQSLAEFAEQRIFAPLKMSHTRYQTSHDEIIPNRASGYKVSIDGRVNTANSNWEPIGDGGVHSTVGDLLIWAQELSSGSVLGSTLQQTMIAPAPKPTDEPGVRYASGLFVSMVAGEKLIRHAGSWYGFTSDFEVVPSKGFAAVALCNIDSVLPQVAPGSYKYPGTDPRARLAKLVSAL
jgi:CubicO group peptidase (beta-lactamase class C family)